VADAGAQTGQPHKGLVKALVIAASVILVIACFSAWAERQALTTDDWVKTSDRLLENEAIQKALANYAVDQLYANVDVEAELDKALPPNFKRLSGPASTGLRSLATSGAERVIATSRFQQAWENANRAAHKTLIAIIEDKGDVVSTSGGEVTLELRPLITQVANQLGIGKDLADQIPPDVGNLKIISSDQLGAAQTIAKLIRGLALVTSLLALGMFALAIYLSRGYRWITVLSVGIGAILAGIVVLILREIAGNVLVDQLATEGAKPAADATWSIGTSLLASIARTVILYGVFFLIAAWLASPHRSAIATRRALTPALRDFPAWVWSVFGVFGIIYVLTGVDSMRAILSRLILLALAGVGIYELRRRSIAEFPDVKMGEMPTRVRARVESMWRGRERLKPEPHDRKLERLERLAALHERGVLSDEEFESEKAAVLAAGGSKSSPPAL
jgi:putative oligomerization/nucleic acid binding protein